MFIALPLVCVVLLVLLVISDANESTFFFINQTILPSQSNAWDWIWQNVTFLGDSLAVVAILLPFAIGRPALVKVVFCAIVSTTLIVQSLKSGLQFPRPVMVLGLEHVHVIGEAIQRRSFPSGHTAAAFVLASILIRYFRVGTFTALALIFIAVLIGISRIIVGAHWPMDVLAGAVIGWLCGYLCICLANHLVLNSFRWTYYLGIFVLYGATVYLLIAHHTGYIQAEGLQVMLASVSLIVSSWLGYKKRA